MRFWRKLQIKIHNRWNDNQFKRIFLLLLFWLSIASLFIGIKFADFLSQITNDLTECKYMWVLLLFLPIPIASVMLGIKYKRIGYSCKKNIIGGAIMIFFLCIYSYFTVFYFAHRDYLFDDYSYLNQLEEKIQFDFPNQGKIFTSKLEKIVMPSYQIIATSKVEFNNQEEIKDLEKRIQDSNIWTNHNTTILQSIEPTIYIEKDDKNIYYLIYIEDFGALNEIPTQTGTYKSFCFMYDMDQNILNIYEYYLMFKI